MTEFAKLNCLSFETLCNHGRRGRIKFYEIV